MNFCPLGKRLNKQSEVEYVLDLMMAEALSKSRAKICDNFRVKDTSPNFWLFILLFNIFLAFALIQPGIAQGGYSIINPSVNPEYGYDDFTYSAQVAMSSDLASEVG